MVKPQSLSDKKNKLLEIIMLNTQSNRLEWAKSTETQNFAGMVYTAQSGNIILRFQSKIISKRLSPPNSYIDPPIRSVHDYSLLCERDNSPELLFDSKEMPQGLSNLHALIIKQLEMNSMDSLIDEFLHG